MNVLNQALTGGALEAAQRCCVFFASVIKSGEKWSPECQHMLDAAMVVGSPDAEAANTSGARP